MIDDTMLKISSFLYFQRKHNYWIEQISKIVKTMGYKNDHNCFEEFWNNLSFDEKSKASYIFEKLLHQELKQLINDKSTKN